VAACGKEVTDLQRLTMGPLQLDSGLALGEWRRLTKEEMKSLERFQVEL
jgi:pseudouridylate synthase